MKQEIVVSFSDGNTEVWPFKPGDELMITVGEVRVYVGIRDVIENSTPREPKSAPSRQ